MWDAFLFLRSFSATLGHVHAVATSVETGTQVIFFTISFVGCARAWKHDLQTGAERQAAFVKMLIVLGSGLGALLSFARKHSGKQDLQM